MCEKRYNYFYISKSYFVNKKRGMRKRDHRSYNLIQNSIIFGLGVAFLSGAITSIIIGINPVFLLALTAGIALGLANTVLLNYFAKRALDKGSKMSFIFSGYLRIFVFLVLFYFAITKFGNIGGLGAGMGYISSYVGIMISAKFLPKDNPDLKYCKGVEYVDGKPKFLLIKDFDMVKTLNGRTFVTHRLFKKVEEAKNA